MYEDVSSVRSVLGYIYTGGVLEGLTIGKFMKCTSPFPGLSLLFLHHPYMSPLIIIYYQYVKVCLSKTRLATNVF